jgi:hypothetical protein
MVQTAESGRACARCAATFSDVSTLSTSCRERASSSERGRPDQMTDSGSMGGMKSVDMSVAIS